MIPLNEAIEMGVWLRADFPANGSVEEGLGKEISFQFKPISFSKIDLAKVDDPFSLEIDLSSNVWCS